MLFFPPLFSYYNYIASEEKKHIIEVFRTECTHVTHNCFVLQVKQEADEVICIKQEPEDEQELMATLLDCQIQQPHLSESQVHLVPKNKSGASLFAAQAQSLSRMTFVVLGGLIICFKIEHKMPAFCRIENK